MSFYNRLASGFLENMGRQRCRQCHGFIEKGANILDLGCGSGIVGKALADYFQSRVLGVDIKDLRTTDIPFQIIDGKHLPFEDNSFEVVFINYVLHHTKEPEPLLKEAVRVAQEKIIIAEDLPDDFFTRLLCRLHGFGFGYFVQQNGVLAKFKSEDEWRGLFNELHLRIIFEKPVSSPLNPLKKKLFILEKNGCVVHR